MRPEILLSVCLIIVLAACGLWDVSAIFGGRKMETVSALIQQWSVRWPVLPFVAGLLSGHLFWPS